MARRHALLSCESSRVATPTSGDALLLHRWAMSELAVWQPVLVAPVAEGGLGKVVVESRRLPSTGGERSMSMGRDLWVVVAWRRLQVVARQPLW
jgi:hypothetical protein